MYQWQRQAYRSLSLVGVDSVLCSVLLEVVGAATCCYLLSLWPMNTNVTPDAMPMHCPCAHVTMCPMCPCAGIYTCVRELHLHEPMSHVRVDSARHVQACLMLTRLLFFAWPRLPARYMLHAVTGSHVA